MRVGKSQGALVSNLIRHRFRTAGRWSNLLSMRELLRIVRGWKPGWTRAKLRLIRQRSIRCSSKSASRGSSLGGSSLQAWSEVSSGTDSNAWVAVQSKRSACARMFWSSGPAKGLRHSTGCAGASRRQKSRTVASLPGKSAACPSGLEEHRALLRSAQTADGINPRLRQPSVINQLRARASGQWRSAAARAWGQRRFQPSNQLAEE
jgi:hypothetical protein